MSYRIHRSIGWAMPWRVFEEKTLIAIKHEDLAGTIEERFSLLRPEDLTVPKEAVVEMTKTLKQRIVAPKLLKLNFGKNPDVFAAPTTLYSLVSDPDKTSHIVFYPDAHHAAKWNRDDDDIDYAFELWRNLDSRGSDQAEPRNVAVYVERGFYPWSDSMTDIQGNPVSWDEYQATEPTRSIFPAVPCGIRWYLTRHGILSDDAVTLLRPAIFQYWG